MRLFCILLAGMIAGCNHNSNEDVARKRLEQSIVLPNGYYSDVAVDWDMRALQYAQAMGEIGKNETPDTVYGIDTTGTLLLIIGKEYGVGFERLRDGGALYHSHTKGHPMTLARRKGEE